MMMMMMMRRRMTMMIPVIVLSMFICRWMSDPIFPNLFSVPSDHSSQCIFTQ